LSAESTILGCVACPLDTVAEYLEGLSQGLRLGIDQPDKKSPYAEGKKRDQKEMFETVQD
jgi:hypothetical protein